MGLWGAGVETCRDGGFSFLGDAPKWNLVFLLVSPGKPQTTGTRKKHKHTHTHTHAVLELSNFKVESSQLQAGDSV